MVVILIYNIYVELNKVINTIEENNTNISSGEKQLLSLARTLLKKAKVIILDEIGSSLERKKAIRIRNVLQKLKKDHTIIIITHKKEWLKIADQILVLDKGKIKEKRKELNQDSASE